MIEKPTRFGSKRFREVLGLALRGDLRLAALGIYWFLTRRRVRGWGMLLRAAAEGPFSYDAWTRSGERRTFVRFRDAYPSLQPPRLAALILADPSDATKTSVTAESLRLALGETASIYATSAKSESCKTIPGASAKDIGAMLSFLGHDEPISWLLPVLAGDCFSSELGDILSRVLHDCSGSSAVYWDEDRLSSGRRMDPWVKPDWDPLLFGRLDGVTGSCALRFTSARVQLDKVGSLALDRCGVTQLTRALASEVKPRHVPLLLTHRSDANALGWDLKSAIFSPHSERWPSVSVLVPTRDRGDLLEACVRGIEQTAYPGPLELIIIDNGSVEPAAIRILARLKSERQARVIDRPGPFNFSELNNCGAAAAAGEFLCLLNNDVEPLEPNWLRTMVSYAVCDEVGAVGALLLYPSGRIQHAGVAVGVGGAAGHVQKGIDPADRRFRTWHAATRQVSAVTAAAMVVRKASFQKVGGFDELAFPVAFNDVDLCLRLGRAGLRNIFVAEARLLHRESESRGNDRSPQHAARFAAELSKLQARWNTKEYLDPYYSPLFSQVVERCVLRP